MHSEREMTFGVSQFDRFVNEGERERRELSLESVWLWVGPTKRERRERESLLGRGERTRLVQKGERRERESKRRKEAREERSKKTKREKI